MQFVFCFLCGVICGAAVWISVIKAKAVWGSLKDYIAVWRIVESCGKVWSIIVECSLCSLRYVPSVEVAFTCWYHRTSTRGHTDDDEEEDEDGEEEEDKLIVDKYDHDCWWWSKCNWSPRLFILPLLDPILCELIFISFMSFVSLIALDSHMCSELTSLDVLVCQSTIFQFQSTVLMSKFKGTI